MRHLLAALAVALVIPVAAEAATTTSLPAVKRTLSASGTTGVRCDQGLRTGRGIATTKYRAPLAGFVDVRSSGTRGDWDLALYDARNAKRAVAGSNGFGSAEVTQSWASLGREFVIQACHRSGSSTTLSVAITFTDVAMPKTDMAPQMLRVTVKRQDIGKLENLGLDVTHSARVGSVDVLAYTTKQLASLAQAGFKYRVLDANVTKSEQRQAELTRAYAATDGPSALPTGRKDYRNLEDFEAELKQIVKNYPSIARPVELPKKSFQGRPLMGVELSDNVAAKDDGKPVYFVMGTHHAREWPAAEIPMEFAWYIAKGYGSDDEITSLLKRERIVVVPIINPDGYVTSRTTPSAYDTTGAAPFDTAEIVAGGGFGAYRRKTCSGAVPDGTFPCLLQWGVDPNRNYGEGWGAAGASSNPYTQTFRGFSPWSETETQAVHEYSQNHQVTALLTVHNFASLVLRSPGLRVKGKAIDEDRLKQLGDTMADDTGYTSQFGWQLYDTSGTTEDWNYAAAGTYGYTIELGPADWQGGMFHVAYPQAVVEQWIGRKSRAGKGMRAAMMTLAEAGANPADHAIIKGSAPAGSILRVKRSFKTATGSGGSECTIADPTDLTDGCEGSTPSQAIDDYIQSTTVVPASGQYEWHVGPSTRPFVLGSRFPSKDVHDGRSDTVNGAAAPDQSGGAGGENDHVDVPFTITDADNAQLVNIDLTWTGQAQDLDLEVYRKTGDPDEPQQVGTSGNQPGIPEHVELTQPQTGEYFARVVNYLAAPGTPFTLTVKRQTAGPDVITMSGKTEAWKMTCETPDGKVLESRDVTVGRGDVSVQDFSCGQPAAAAAPKAKTKAKKKLTKRQACLRKANRARSKAKRRAAVTRCNKRYPAKAKHKAKSKKRAARR